MVSDVLHAQKKKQQNRNLRMNDDAVGRQILEKTDWVRTEIEIELLQKVSTLQAKN